MSVLFSSTSIHHLTHMFVHLKTTSTLVFLPRFRFFFGLQSCLDVWNEALTISAGQFGFSLVVIFSREAQGPVGWPEHFVDAQKEKLFRSFVLKPQLGAVLFEKIEKIRTVEILQVVTWSCRS